MNAEVRVQLERERIGMGRFVVRMRERLTTKIHALGNPVEVMLTPGQDHDLTCAEPLIEAVDPGTLIADEGGR